MENNLDKLFKSKLEGQEPEFSPAAWDRMEGLLDDVGMIPAQQKPNRSKRTFLFLLFSVLLLSGIGYISMKSSNILGEGSTLANDMETLNEENKTKEKEILSTTRPSSQSIRISKDKSNVTSKEQNIDAEIKNENQVQKLRSEKSFDGNENHSTSTSNESKIKTKSNDLSLDGQPTSYLANVANSRVEKNKSLNKVDPQSSEENIIDDNKVENINANKRTESLENALVNSSKEVDSDVSDGGDRRGNESALIDALTAKDLIPLIAQLDTKVGILKSPDVKITPQLQMPKPSLFEIGVQGSVRLNGGRGYSIGSYISYNIGKGYSVNLGGQFDSQNFENGPGISVFDKVYSFGSKIHERQFVLNNQKSLRVPLALKKTFNKFDIYTGIVVNRVLVSEGNISDQGENMVSAAIDNEFIKSMTYSFQAGASVELTRFFDLEVGIEYRPKPFISDSSIFTNSSQYYPTIGLRYKLFKF